MNLRPIIAIAWLIAGNCPAVESIVPRTDSEALDASYVMVALDSLANDHQGFAPPAQRVTIQGIPFDLVAKAGADNLFLREAGWPDWQQDPSAFFAAYDTAPTNATPQRPFVQIPVADYDSVYLLAAADPDTDLSAVVTFRLGVFAGRKRTTIHDFAAAVPRATATGGEHVVQVLPGKSGNVFLLRVPLGAALAQDFQDRQTLDVEITKELRLAIRRPDPCRYQYRPLGLPSGVHLYGLTFHRAAVGLAVSSDEPGHVFVEPQTPMFHVDLTGLEAGQTSWTVEAVATDLDGRALTVRSKPVKTDTRLSLSVPVQRRGYYRLDVAVRRGNQNPVLTRRTHFALLAPDTRQHRDTAPWGAWSFHGQHFTPTQPEVEGPLYFKAGLRYGMFWQSAEARRPYGVIMGNDPTCRDAKTLEVMLRKCADGVYPASPERVMIFHEDAISGPHVTRVPDAFTGRPPYRLDEAEQKRFDTLWNGALEAARGIRERFPKAMIYFGNGTPQLFEEFLRHGFPREMFDTRGNESSSFQRLPETQPLDFIANNASLWMDRQILDHYGYTNVTVSQCFEVCYPSTNPGNLSLRTQAAHLVRHILHSMAWEVPLIRTAVITDVGNSYYYGNWGSSGLCFAQPDIAPKPAYAAVATLTRVLDGATFSRVLPCAAPTVYALEFRQPDGGYVACLWTIRGHRPVQLRWDGVRKARLIDLMGNESPLAVKANRATVDISGQPVYVRAPAPLAELTAGSASLDRQPVGKAFLISSLDLLQDWTVESEPNRELEVYNAIDSPRRQGDFRYRVVPEFEGERKVLEVKPKLPVAGAVYLPMYSVLRHSTGVQLPGEPTEIGLMVNGNGGWGRIIFELEDASGQRWTSIGCEQKGEPTRWLADWLPAAQFQTLKTSNLADWNTNDPWGRSSINFEGWHYLRFPLPGNYPGERYHWPSGSQWRFSGDGVVKYPLTFKKLIVTIPEKVLKFRDYTPVPRQEIYLKNLAVMFATPEQAFRTE